MNLKRLAPIAGIIAFLIAVVVIGKLITGGAAPTDNNASSSPILTIQTTGGLCPYGLCGSETTVMSDGGYSRRNGEDDPRTGVLQPGVIGDLRRQIDDADYDDIRSRPFTGTCPSAYDGTEYIYILRPKYKAAQTISSCQYDLTDIRLFRTINDVSFVN